MKKKIIVVLLILMIIGSVIFISTKKNKNNSIDSSKDMISNIAKILMGEDAKYDISEEDSGVLDVNGYTIYSFDYILQVYLYSSKEQAMEDVKRFNETGDVYTRDNKTSIISWQDQPHFFLYENCIILYLGNDSLIISKLTEKFGVAIIG